MERSPWEKAKLCMVLVLAVIFVAVGYYRFFYTPKKSGPAAGASRPDIQLTVPELTAPALSGDGKAGVPPTAGQPRFIRDIFSPGTMALASITPAPIAEKPKPPSFSLKGTIVAGRHPIALLNNRFVRTGDRIEGYRVVKIDKKNVWLESGSHRVKVETISYE